MFWSFSLPALTFAQVRYIDETSYWNVIFQTCWSSLNNTESFANGGEAIQISGFGFPTSEQYTLKFSTGENSTTSSSISVSLRDLTFLSTEYDFKLANITLLVADNVEISACSSLQSSLFLYKPVWLEIDRYSLPSKGGYLLITGFLFSADMQITVTVRNESKSASFEITAIRQIQCLVPFFTPGTATIVIAVDGVNFLNLNNLQVTLFAGWDNVSLTTDFASAAGNEIFHVYGYGFQSFATCICRFGVSDFMDSEVIIKNDTILEGLTPEWGSYYPEALVMVSVICDNQTLSFTSMGAYNISCSLDNPHCTVKFTAVHFVLEVLRRHAYGGQSYSINGSGFDPTSSYKSIFYINGEAIEGAEQQPISTTRIIFQTPDFSHRQQESNYGYLILYRMPNSTVVYSAQNQTFEILSAWVQVVPNEVLCSGQTVEIFGSSFTEAANGFRCEFSDGNYVQTTTVEFVNSSVLRCTAMWYHPAANTTLNIITNESVAIDFVDLVGRGKRVEFFEVISDYQVTLPCQTGNKSFVVHISGYGFKPDNQYQCVFYSQSDSQYLTDIVDPSTSSTVITWTSQSSVTCEVRFESILSQQTIDGKCFSLMLSDPRRSIGLLNNPDGSKCVNFSSYWSSLSPNYDAQIVDVAGAGFTTGLRYYCEFPEVGITNDATVVSSEKLVCNLPASVNENSTSLSVQILLEDRVICCSSGSDCFLTLAPYWKTYQPTGPRFPAKGGAVIAVTGELFTYISTLYCVYEGTSGVTEEAVALNRTRGSWACKLPTWPKAENVTLKFRIGLGPG
eukprot:765396-Hanusia_phi.AAC.1